MSDDTKPFGSYLCTMKVPYQLLRWALADRARTACSVLETCHTLSKRHTGMPADISAAPQPHEPQNTPERPTVTNPKNARRLETPGGTKNCSET